MAVIAGEIFDFLLLKRLLWYAVPYRKTMGIALAVIFFVALITPVRPWLIKYAIDYCILQPDKELLFIIGGIIIAVILIEAFMQFAEEYYTGLLGQLVIHDLRIHVFSHITRFRIHYFDKTPIGTLVTRVISDIETIADVFADGLLIIAGDILQIILILSVMFYMNWQLTLLSLTSIPLLLIATWFFKNGVKDAFQEVRTQVARINAFVQEHLTGMSTVQIFNREQSEFKKFRLINEDHRRAHIRSIWYYSIFFPVVEILAAMSIGMLVWWGTKSVLEDQFTLGSIISFILYIYMMFRPIRQLADRFNTLQMGMVSSERIFRILDAKEFLVNSGTIDASSIKGAIEFRNIWFAYDKEEWVLKDISFSVKPGEKLAIVGATGAGKTSVINLLGRFYEYNRGNILIDGKELRDFEMVSLRKAMAIVPQNVFLFSDSIYNNITLKDRTVTPQQVMAAAKEIGVDELIEKLPGKWNYNVRERGTMLSVGQRQLISFLRAYVHNPVILILDEATSSVDSDTEHLIREATLKLIRNRTSIIVAHRLSTIQHSDKILVVDQGRIVESGSHRELLEKDGIYRKLHDLQFVFA